MGDPYFDVNPELAEYRQALNAAWILIGRHTFRAVEKTADGPGR